MNQSKRGGYRVGSGRPSNWKSGKTTVIKIPVALKEQVLDLAHRLDDGENLHTLIEEIQVFVTISKEGYNTVIDRILEDIILTRNGKDKAAIRRALETLGEILF